eukprot:jgi/Chrzof1/6251/Cz17g17140.t1
MLDAKTSCMTLSDDSVMQLPCPLSLVYNKQRIEGLSFQMRLQPDDAATLHASQHPMACCTHSCQCKTGVRWDACPPPDFSAQ